MIRDDTMATRDLDAILNRVLLDDDARSCRLNEHEVGELLSLWGITAAETHVLALEADVAARRCWSDRVLAMSSQHNRFVLKVLGRDILHKSDIGGVQLIALDSAAQADDVLRHADEMLTRLRSSGVAQDVEGLLACEYVPHQANTPGAEILLSLRQDSAFGPIVIVGVGGVLTEWYGRATAGNSRIILPARNLTSDVAAAAVMAHPVLSILCSPSRLHRDPPIAPERFVAAMMAMANLADRCAADRPGPTLEEIEVNPAVISNGRLVAIDGVGLVSRRTWPRTLRPLGRIDHLLAPRSAVVLGASAKGANPGRIIMNNLKRSPGIATDRLYAIHPHQQEIDGVPCLRSLADLPEKVDLVVVCIPAEGARDAIADIVAADRAESIILIPGGFAEAGHGDLAQDIETTLAAGHRRDGQGPVMVGGNCLGIVSRDQYNTFFLPDYKLPFTDAEAGRNLAVVSQSGAYLVTFASNYDGLIHPRASISFGNQMDLTVSDFLEHFLTVDEVDVVACYVEGFREGDGARFLDAARRARREGKTVLIFKAGKTALGAKAAASHTASLAGDYDVARSCLEDAGAVVAQTLDEFEDLIKTFTLLKGRTSRGRRVGIMSNAGFECSTVMDALEGLELKPFDQDVRAVLDEVLPPFAHKDNPCDATPMAGTEAYSAAVEAILASDGVDCAIISTVPVTPALDNLPQNPGRHSENLHGPGSQANRFIRIIGASTKPTVLVVDSGALYDPLVTLFAQAGVPVFRKIDRAARSLACFLEAVEPSSP